jgi:hypothetical protein
MGACIFDVPASPLQGDARIFWQTPPFYRSQVVGFNKPSFRSLPKSVYLCATISFVFPLFILCFPVLFLPFVLSTQQKPVDPEQSKVIFS